jgi:hypothetical protein
MKAVNMPIYDNGIQIWGAEPNKPPVNAVVTPNSGLTAGNHRVTIRQHGKYLYITGADQRAIAVSLISASGKTIASRNAVCGRGLSLELVSPGVYICIVSGGDNIPIATQAIMIQK